MSENPFVQVTYGEVRLVPEGRVPAPPPKRWYSRIPAVLAGTFTAITRLAVILSILALLAVTWREVFGRPVVLEPIGIPEKLVQMGFSEEVAAQRLWDAVVEINAQVETVKGHTPFVAQARQLEVTEPGTGLSIRGLADFIRVLLNRPQTRVAGEFLCGDPACGIAEIELRIRVFDGGRMQIARAGPLGDIASKEDLDAYFLTAGQEMLRIVDPYVLSVFYNDSGDPDAAMQVAEDMIETKHRDLNWGHIGYGVLQAALGNHQTAIASYRRAIELNPDIVIAHNNLGASLNDVGRYEDALVSYRRALELDPEYVFAHYNLGDSLNALGRYEDAIASYRRALELDPAHVGAHNNLGISLRYLGRYEEAVSSYLRALELDPEHTVVLNNWVILLRDTMREKPETCEVHLARLAQFEAVVTARGEFDRMAEFVDYRANCTSQTN